MIEPRTGLTALRVITHTILDTHPVPEALIVPGSDIYTNPKAPKKVRVAWDFKLRLLATRRYYRELCRQGSIPRVILCGGRVMPEFQPTAQYAASYLRQQHFYAPFSTVETSTNPLDDIRHAVRQMRQEDLRTGIVISNNYDIAAKIIALQVGLGFTTAEDLFFHTEPRSRDDLSQLTNSQLVRQLRKYQLVGAALLLIPGGEVIYKQLAKRTLRDEASVTPFNMIRLLNTIEGKVHS